LGTRLDQSEPRDAVAPREPGSLPPEVEAELRRRVRDEAAAVPAPEPAPASPGWQDRLKQVGVIGPALVYLLTKAKFLTLALKFGLPVLKTGGTMLLSILVYAQAWGWWFALGFVLSILVHEMGHVYVAWRMGVPVTAPIFIPGFGALILQKRSARSAWDEALIGIGGPVGGTLAGLFCLLMAALTQSPLMLALAYTGFAINLFNLAPIYPLDGGWITGAVSPRIWLIGIVVMVGLFALGIVRNPLLLLLVLISAPRLWHGLKTGNMMSEGSIPTTSEQRTRMGLAYVSLCALLVWLMAHTHARP
jgi:Zn-dependent protease